MSVDVEDWFHDGGIVDVDPAAHRVERNTDALLDQFAASLSRSTIRVDHHGRAATPARRREARRSIRNRRKPDGARDAAPATGRTHRCEPRPAVTPITE